MPIDRRARHNGHFGKLAGSTQQTEQSKSAKMSTRYESNYYKKRQLRPYQLSRLTPTFTAFVFKNGFNGERPFYGEVTTFDFKAKLYKRDRLLVGAIVFLSAVCLAGTFYIFVWILGRNFSVVKGPEEHG